MTVRSCLNCPSLLSPSESRDFFGKNIGVSVCAKFGKPIGGARTDATKRSDIAKAIAKTCDEFGKPKPNAVDWQRAQFMVSLPDPEVLRFNPRSSQETVRTCGTCAHLVREDIVLSELGWGVGLCSAKGRLILPNRQSFEGRNCEDRSLATSGVRTDVSGLMLLPEYEADFTLSTDPVKFHAQMKAHFVDPIEYPTDFEVTAEDEAEGIRAWRKVEDPNTGNHTRLPIFRMDFFSPEEQAKIPRTGDEEHPEDYVDHGFYTYKVAVLWRELDETPAAWGRAGVGKTEFARYMAWIMCLPFERISITNSSELDDLAGKWTYDPSTGTVWNDGRIVSAWSKPCVLALDEPNAGPPDVFQFCRPMFDNSKQLVVDQNKGERRHRNDHCYPFLAMNPAWDPKNVGTYEISDADANRLMHLYFELPPRKLEIEIITTRCEHDGYKISDNTLKTIMGVAEDVRALSDQDAVPITWGIRPQLKVARASKWFDLMTCYRMAVADFLDPQAQEQVLDAVRSHIE